MNWNELPSLSPKPEQCSFWFSLHCKRLPTSQTQVCCPVRLSWLLYRLQPAVDSGTCGDKGPVLCR